MEQKPLHDVLIIGAGLSGLTLAHLLLDLGYGVAVIEKKAFPHHRVCGEYLSSEVLGLLGNLGVHLEDRPHVNQVVISAMSGKHIHADLPLGGIGVTRHTLDYQLLLTAQAKGLKLIEDTYLSHTRVEDHWSVTVKKAGILRSRLLVDASGKNNSKLEGDFGVKYVGVKQYFQFDLDPTLVVLHNFTGGYCGAVAVENGWVDVAYMIEEAEFKKYRNLDLLEDELLRKNPYLNEILSKPTILEKRLTVSNFTLGGKDVAFDGVFRIGDRFAMIPPATGNGMAIAIQSAVLLSKQLDRCLKEDIDVKEAWISFRNVWQEKFAKRMMTGRIIQILMNKQWASSFIIGLLKTFPKLLQIMIKRTHA